MLKRDIDIILSAKADWKKLQDATVLVTGATGRLGIYIVNALVGASRDFGLNIKVLALARNPEKIAASYPEEMEEVVFLQQDVISPIEWDGPVDYIFHTAGLASPSDFTTRPVNTLWGHVQGTQNVLELAKEKQTKKVLYVSTVEVYGTWKSEDYIKEDDMGPLVHTNSRACYPEAKRLCETMLACYKAEYGVDYVGIRMSHTFGPGISLYDGRAFAEFIRNVVQGEDIVLQSDGSAVRTYTYTADAVGAMFLALLNGTEDYYNVASIDNQISIRDLAELIASMDPKKKVQVRFATKPGQKLLYLPFKLGIIDSTKMLELGWEPKVDIEHAFRWTLESFLEEGEK
ncbi:MAG: NAD-dependent epimerase/dehydratase family protein [Dorea sp.]|nr:NAD-dependent epimerase/dehydratase family protein [Dorea sp.]